MENLLDFIKQNDLYKKFQVDELLFTEFKCPPDESRSSIWWHNNFFAYILSGETLLKTPRAEYILKPGECIFAQKGSVLTMSQSLDEFCELLVFVPDEFIRTVVRKHKIPLAKVSAAGSFDTIIPLPQDDVLLSYFQSLLSYFSMPDPPSPTLLRIKFEELIVQIGLHRNAAPLQFYFRELCESTRPSIKEIMELNFATNLTLDEYAGLCSRSLSTFKREFKELYHTTPGKWLMSKRLEYSKYLLETTAMTVEEVCLESGFENRSHFIRVFRNRFGLTPGKIERIPFE